MENIEALVKQYGEACRQQGMRMTAARLGHGAYDDIGDTEEELNAVLSAVANLQDVIADVVAANAWRP